MYILTMIESNSERDHIHVIGVAKTTGALESEAHGFAEKHDFPTPYFQDLVADRRDIGVGFHWCISKIKECGTTKGDK